MLKKSIFITGSTGCIGHYVLDRFMADVDCDLHLLVRDPNKFPARYLKPHVHLHAGDLENIQLHQDILSQCTHMIHIATAWGDSDYSSTLNKDKTHEMFSYLDPHKLEKIVYFSTASILGPGNVPVIEAETMGTGYIRSKYRAYLSLKESAYASKLVTVFPTMVFGGDATHPYSHISSGILPSLPYLKWVRFLNMHGAFHFLHAADIATVVHYALTHDTDPDLVLGNPVITGKEAVQTLCKVFKVPCYFQIKITSAMLIFLAKLFKIKVAPWDTYCIKNPFFQYRTVNPGTWGLPAAFPTLDSVLTDIVNRQ